LVEGNPAKLYGVPYADLTKEVVCVEPAGKLNTNPCDGAQRKDVARIRELKIYRKP